MACTKMSNTITTDDAPIRAAAIATANPWASIRQETPVQQDAAAGKPFLLLWIHQLRIFAPFVDTDAGLREARATLVDQWNALRAPLHTAASDIRALEGLFCIKRVRPGVAGPDEVVCTFHQAIQTPHACLLACRRCLLARLASAAGGWLARLGACN